MGLMKIDSHSRLQVGTLFWQPGRNDWSCTIICKATFTLKPDVSALAVDQEKLNEGDQHWENKPHRSLRAVTDLVPYKKNSDVLLVGQAFACDERVRSLVAKLEVPGLGRSIEVFCDRWWSRDGSVVEGARFRTMPLCYERAAGSGTKNPVGMAPDGPPDKANGLVPIPNLQTRGLVVNARNVHIEPIGFGPIDPTWPERASKFKMGVAVWSHTLCELGPLHIDPKFFNAAPLDQQLNRAIRADEKICLEHLHPQYRSLKTRLPGVQPRVSVERVGGEREDVPMVCDTLWIDTERSICTLTWRAPIKLSHREERGRIVVKLVEGGEISEVPSLVSDAMDATPSPESAESDEVVHLLTKFSPQPLPPAARQDETDAGILGPPTEILDLRQLGSHPPVPPIAPPTPVPPHLPQIPHDDGGLLGPPTEVLDFRKLVHPPDVPRTPVPPPAPPDASRTPVPPPAPSSAARAPVPPQAPGSAPRAQVPDTPHVVQSQEDTKILLIQPDGPATPFIPALAPAPPMAPPSQPATPAYTASPPAPAPQSSFVPPSQSMAPAYTANPAAATFGLPSSIAYGPRASAPSLIELMNTEPRGTPGAPPVDSPAEPEPITERPAARASEMLNLLWFEPNRVARMRKLTTWRTILELREQRRKDRDLDDPDFETDSKKAEDEGDVFEILARGDPMNARGIEFAVADATRDDGKFIPPLVLVSGELRLPFDELETLKASITVATHFAVGDKKLKEVLDEANEILKTPGLQSSSGVAEGLTSRIRDAVKHGTRTVLVTHLDQYAERTLIEQRHFRKRTVFGGTSIFGMFHPTDVGNPIPAYLPDHLSKNLPIFQRFRARLIAEVHMQQDQQETHTLALRVVALARATPALRRR